MAENEVVTIEQAFYKQAAGKKDTQNLLGWKNELQRRLGLAKMGIVAMNEYEIVDLCNQLERVVKVDPAAGAWKPEEQVKVVETDKQK